VSGGERVARYVVQIDGEAVEVDLEEEGELLRLRIGEREVEVDLQLVSDPSLFSVIVENRPYEVLVEQREDGYEVLVGGERLQLRIPGRQARPGPARAAGSPDGESQIRAPMPGIVLSVEVVVGKRVDRGQSLLVLSAMKMENQIKAPRAGVVKSVGCEPGQTVEQGQVLLVLA
jgi:biotin carboxyl carrier protein